MIVIISIDFLSHLKTVTSVISGLKLNSKFPPHDSLVLFSDLSPSDWGTYHCSAHNDLGDASTAITLTGNAHLQPSSLPPQTL